jgi:hypothetical protein
MIRRLWIFALDHSLLLLVGAAAGLAWANLAPHTYDQFVRAIHFVINDIGMAFFLHSPRKRSSKPQLPVPHFIR